jgi:hypothetical protein
MVVIQKCCAFCGGISFVIAVAAPAGPNDHKEEKAQKIGYNDWRCRMAHGLTAVWPFFFFFFLFCSYVYEYEKLFLFDLFRMSLLLSLYMLKKFCKLGVLGRDCSCTMRDKMKASSTMNHVLECIEIHQVS